GCEYCSILCPLSQDKRWLAQALGRASLEQRRAVHPRNDLDLGGQRADVPQAAAVDAEGVGEDPLADQLLGDGTVGSRQLLLPAVETLLQGPEHLVLDLRSEERRVGKGCRVMWGG